MNEMRDEAGDAGATHGGSGDAHGGSGDAHVTDRPAAPVREEAIGLAGLAVPCRIGVTDEERREAQTLLVDVRLVPLVVSGHADDDLAGTIDYGAVAAEIVALAAAREYRLIERLATVVADRLWDQHELAGLSVTVRKPSPPVGAPARDASAEIVYRRP